MNYTRNFEGVRLDVQAVGFTPDEQIEERIQKMLSYLTRFSSGKLVYATVYLEDKESKATRQKSVKVILGVPGPDIVASESGDHFMALLSDVEAKLARQLKK